MNADIFLKWLKHFVKFVKPNLEKQVLLLLDGDSSHKSLNVIEFVKQSGVLLCCFPPHCTHRVQPQDVSFYCPLKTYYNQKLNNWLSNLPGRTITHYQLATLFLDAYLKAATLKNAQSGFASTGICAFNANVFPDHMFAPAEVTDIPVVPETTEQIEADVDKSSYSAEAVAVPSSRDAEASKTSTTSFNDMSISDMLHLPSAPTTQTARKTNRRKGKFGIIYSSPEIQAAKHIVAKKIQML